MDKRKKILESLQCCRSQIRNCAKCPYGDKDFPACLEEAINDALEFIEPRVLTLEEAMARGEEESAVWLEYRGGGGEWVILHTRGAFLTYYSQDWAESLIQQEYGVKVRCWNVIPSDEQRRAVPWEVMKE